jgi:Flp pilus assembly protein TadB
MFGGRQKVKGAGKAGSVLKVSKLSNAATNYRKKQSEQQEMYKYVGEDKKMSKLLKGVNFLNDSSIIVHPGMRLYICVLCIYVLVIMFCVSMYWLYVLCVYVLVVCFVYIYFIYFFIMCVHFFSSFFFRYSDTI